MNILALSGSASPDGSNYLLLEALKLLFEGQHIVHVYNQLHEFPLFTPEKLKGELPENIRIFKELLLEADAVIIATPEYTHNIPAVLKNMLEWCTASGEFNEKPVLPITFTPHEPRGEFAMQSLIFSLTTLKAKVVAEFPLYKSDLTIEEKKIILPKDIQEMLIEVVGMM